MPAGLERYLKPYAEPGIDAEGLGPSQHKIQLAGHLDDDKAIEAELDGVQGKIDELFVLVAVADNAGLGILDHGYGDDELGLAPGLKAVMVAARRSG